MSIWNGKRFSIYSSEEKSTLKLIQEVGEISNTNTNEIENLKESNNKKISKEDMTTIYKLDENANFTGSWYGIKKPTASQEGLQATVDKINEEDIPNIIKSLNNILINVKSFGVKGDGVTHESDKIQEFLDFCSENKAMGIIPKGVYILDKQLTIKSNTHLIFDDMAEFKQIHEYTMINIQNNKHTGYDGYKNIKIENGTFNCNGSVVLDPMNCFFIQHAQNVEFNNCTFKNVHSYHALDINGSKDIRVLNCKFLNSYDSINKSDREAIQIDIAAPTEGEQGVSWDYTPTKNVLIENCYFGKDDVNALPYTSAIGSHNIRYGKYYENIIIRNCEIDGCSKYAISGWKWNNCIIENNLISNCGGGIKLDTPHRNSVSANDENNNYKGMENSYGNIIMNNIIKNVSSEGIFLRGKYITSPTEGESGTGLILRCKVSKNTITQKGGGVSAIILLNSTECIVNDNVIIGSLADGIRCYSSFKNVFSNNKIYQPSNYGISISNATLTGTDSCGRCDGNKVENNMIEYAVKCAIFLTGSASNSNVKNNTCKACNTSTDSSISIINISANSNDIVVSENLLIDNETFKNSVFVTNTCKRVIVANNITNTGSGTKYYNSSIEGLLVNNI